MMQLASCLVAIGGDSGNTVPKIHVTPSELEVLRLIHGNDAVTEIFIVGKVNRSSRVERQRLLDIYKKRMPNGTEACPELDSLFPGVAARLYESFDEIEDIDDSFFRSEPFKVKEEKQKIELENEEIIYDSDPLAIVEETPEPTKAKASRKKSVPVIADPVPAGDEGDDSDDSFGEMPDAAKLFG